MYLPKPVVQVTQDTPAPNTPAPRTAGYFVAARPLPPGTLARDEDFEIRSVPSGSVPSGAIHDTPDARIRLRGSLVRNFLDAGSPVTSQDVLRPRDRGFLASVLAPGSRAISINVDAESGVSGLIWPGDHVDVVLTQVFEKSDTRDPKDPRDPKDVAQRTLSDTVLHNVRVIAVDQDIVQGAPANNATAGKVPQKDSTVSLQVAPEQVELITVAQRLAQDRGKLSLAVLSAVDPQDKVASATTFSGAVSPKIDRQNATVKIYRGGQAAEYIVPHEDAGSTNTMLSGDVSPKFGSQSAKVNLRGRKG